MRVRSALPRCVLLTAGILGLILSSITLSFPVIAQDSSASSQEKAKQSNTEGLQPLPLSPIEKAEQDGTALRLSLKEITRLALQQNLDIAIQDTNTQSSKEKIKEQKGNYDPQLTGDLSTSSSRSANTQKFDVADSNTKVSDDSSWNFGLNQQVPTGGNFRVSWNTSRSASNTTSSTFFSPNYQGKWSVSFTQPLWRNLKLDSTRANIKLANLDLNTTESQFKSKVTDVISNIQTSYWELVSAIRNYDIRRKSVELAQINLRDNRKKVEVGTMAPIEVTDAETNVASRAVDLISAEETILQAENTLRQLISNDRNSDIWKKVIVPTDRPDFKEYKVALDTAINNALKNRPELEQARISLETLDINTQLTRNNRKWKIDATGSFGSNGYVGYPDYLGTLYDRMFSDGYTNWTFSLSITIPLRNRTNDAQLAQREISKRNQLLSLRKQEQSIQVEVRNALQTLESNRKQVESAGIASNGADERLKGEQKRLEAGLSQNYLVLDRQNQLATAQYNELQALIRYKRAIITLQKAMYTLLEANDFEVAKGISSRIPNLK